MLQPVQTVLLESTKVRWTRFKGLAMKGVRHPDAIWALTSPCPVWVCAPPGSPRRSETRCPTSTRFRGDYEVQEEEQVEDGNASE
ncbi:hypothetical protein Taro_017328 [Colocasia esculenta]|uniref:Uncharacterized protein n=1 Tax=Colocasia esculenta TaxID=4460 RepID=A0A843UZ17_COLES|nr:hypothetical protein [Colocasia esculenta]